MQHAACPPPSIPPAKLSRQKIDESISIADFFLPKLTSRHCRFLPSKLTRRFLLPISSRQIEESISIADFFPPN
jgi:hypothetical protein